MYQDADLQTGSRSKPRSDQALRVESCISMLEVEREFESPILRGRSSPLTWDNSGEGALLFCLVCSFVCSGLLFRTHEHRETLNSIRLHRR